MEEQSRRELLLYGLMGLGSLGGAGAITYFLSTRDRERIELEDLVLTDSGKVVGKKYIEGRYLHPADNFNPGAQFTARGMATKMPDRYKVTVEYKHGQVTLNDRGLFNQVNKGDRVTVEFSKAMKVKRTYQGELLESKIDGYRVRRLIPQARD